MTYTERDFSLKFGIKKIVLTPDFPLHEYRVRQYMTQREQREKFLCKLAEQIRISIERNFTGQIS